MAEKVSPFLMFTGEAEEAMLFYTSLFHDSRVVQIERRPPEPGEGEGKVKLATFILAGQELLCSDSPIRHAFTFTPSLSLFVHCESETELEAAYMKLSAGGEVLMPLDAYDFSRKFGWVNDRFGVSWQLYLA